MWLLLGYQEEEKNCEVITFENNEITAQSDHHITYYLLNYSEPVLSITLASTAGTRLIGGGLITGILHDLLVSIALEQEL